MPKEFVAFTVNVYDVPLVNPVKVVDRTFPTFTETPADDFTVYDVMVEPPLDVGATQDTFADALPATAETLVGTVGINALGVILIDAEATESPTVFLAFTVAVTVTPLVKVPSELFV